MKPISFQCTRLIPASAHAICTEIANVDAWNQFGGYGVLPGIEKAAYETRTEDMVGSRIRVRNTDGSGHVEEILQWTPGKAVAMKLHEFTPPLSSLASHFLEEWTLVPEGSGTRVTRSFQLHPAQPVTRPLLWLISLLFRRAIERHLEQMAAMSSTTHNRNRL